MLQRIIICILFSKTLAQFDGDFWWLRPQLDKYRTGASAEPKFEDLSEFDTDESAKILFKDEDFISAEENYRSSNFNKPPNVKADGKTKIVMHFQDKSQMAWPDEVEQEASANKLNKIYSNSSRVKKGNDNINEISASTDIFEFKFPDDDDFVWKDYLYNRNKTTFNKTTEKMSSTTMKTLTNNVKNNTDRIFYIENKIPVKVHKDVDPETESICTFIKKSECNRIGGVVYFKHGSEQKRSSFDYQFVCCILPVRPQFASSKIYFMDDNKPYTRFKRSDKDDGTNTALKQRNTLLQRRFGSPVNKPNTITQRPNRKVVTPSDEYVDPYWNIKNSDFQSSNRQPHSIHQTSSTKHDYYGSDDYIEDYIVELPTPGLVGLYSDHGPSKPAWGFPSTSPYGGGADSVEDEGNFGYSPTIDPRLEDRLATTRPRVSGRPVKLTTQSEEKTYDIETQTLSYQSNPDFQVLDGFKLLNLVRNKSRIFRNGKKTTTERFFENASGEHVLTASLEGDDFGNAFDKGENQHSDCGKVVKGANRNYDLNKEIGETTKGAHPSLALVVLTKRRQSVLCYATIVHSRAAITAADCVYGRTSPGEITLIAGAWRLNDESQEEWQKRMGSVQIHSKYKPGDLGNNLALLFWKRPLRFTVSVQPACLSDPHVGDHCKFFGWGGYDQAIKKQSRWQRAIILAPTTCAERISTRHLPTETFCAAVQARGTVTGIGGALMCNVGSRQAAVGVAVWRDHAVVLQPAREWTLQTLSDLQLD